MVLLPLKLICTQSGKTARVSSFQPPPLLQLRPARSSLLTEATVNDWPGTVKVLDAEATPPLLAKATLIWPDALTTCDSGGLLDAALPASPPYAATMLCVPALKELVVQAAVRVFPAPISATAEQPAIDVPPSLKFTLPVGAMPVTDAVKMTLEPTVDGLAELTTEIVVGGGPAAVVPQASISVMRE